MTAEVLFLANGGYIDDSTGSFMGVHLERGELILHDEAEEVHSPLHRPAFFAPVGSLRKLVMLETLMQEPERRFPGNYFLKEWGNIFHSGSDVSKTIWSLRLTVADIGLVNRTGTSSNRKRTTFSLIHSGPEGYSLMPYNIRDCEPVLPALVHSMSKDVLVFRSAQYDYSKHMLRD